MNNKGQTLILLVFILPIILLLMALLINYGMLNNQKVVIENNIEQAIEYGLKLRQEDNMKQEHNLSNEELEAKLEHLLEQNITYDTLEIDVKNTIITVKVTVLTKSFMTDLVNLEKRIEFSYYGSINNGKIEIERR